MTEYEFMKMDLARSPSWRHDYVMKTSDQRIQAVGDGDDPLMRSYRGFVSELRAAGTDERLRETVFDCYFRIGRAYNIFASPDQEIRRELEARLLTTESFDDIGERLSTGGRMIHAFEQLFFNVRDRLQSKAWVQLAVLRPPAGGPFDAAGNLRDEQRWYTYRRLAYYGGALALDEVVDAMVPADGIKTTGDAIRWMDASLRRKIHSLAACAPAQLTPQNSLRHMKRGLGIPPPSAASDEWLADMGKRLQMVLKSLTAAFPPELFADTSDNPEAAELERPDK